MHFCFIVHKIKNTSFRENPQDIKTLNILKRDMFIFLGFEEDIKGTVQLWKGQKIDF